jgi:hypothetical protein
MIACMRPRPSLVENLRHRPVLVVITGAGASYDSILSLPVRRDFPQADRPPLTQQLFADRNLREFLGPYPAGRSLISALAIDPEASDFETLLNREYEASEGSPTLLSRFVALRLYLRDMLMTYSERWSSLVGGATNYAWIVGELDHWITRQNGYVAWVTFNYDPLLEDALADHYHYDFGYGGPDDPYLSPYVAHPSWSLLHLHGSARWTRLTDIPRGPLGQQNVAEALVDRWDGKDLPSDTTVYQRVRTLNPDPERRNAVLLGQGLDVIGVPALTTPLASKSWFECPPSHVDHLMTVLTQSDFVLALGWRAQEPHFIKLATELLGNTPDIAAVSQSQESAGRVCGSLRVALGAPSPVRFTASDATGFSGFRAMAGPGFRDEHRRARSRFSGPTRGPFGCAIETAISCLRSAWRGRRPSCSRDRNVRSDMPVISTSRLTPIARSPGNTASHSPRSSTYCV